MGRGEGFKIEIVDEILREFYDRILPVVSSEFDETRRYLRFFAWLNTWLERRGFGRIIVTGGFAVEVYTGRAYRTMDIDIVVEGVEAIRIIEEFLRRIAERIGRGYLPYIEAISTKSIDIVSTIYDREMKPVKLMINSEYIYLEPPEELIIRYLAAWKFWGSTEDRDKAIWLYYIWRDRIDIDYIARKTMHENTYDKFIELQNIVSSTSKGI
ncbi:conserved hypothetical protein [Ignisphaera aggregans DSM 17230]|uniref:Nucleotidyl transferase AbiEii/AbiGii toxin family protein n=1 Tax=Ignisphaera aggregans (strain DSM 17230 / JCM 13409 / AQ1.S1) TaxID=583356 RepID=E0SST3_IGNAA|nr:conserved hypothetical protein [Ignisphaera aggregans DSM 17230]